MRTTVTIHGPDGIGNAVRVNIIEEDLNNDSFPVKNNMVEDNKVKDVHIGKFAIETLRLTYK